MVLGMVFFTWAFVQRLDPDEISDDEADSTTTTTVATSEPSDSAESTTTTTLPSDLQQYLDQITSDQETLAVIAADMDAVNAAWDDRENTGVTYGETEDAFEQIVANDTIFRDGVTIHLPPAGYGEALGQAHEQALDASEQVLSGAEAVLEGLQAPDTGQARQAALLDFRAAVAEFDIAVEEITAAVSQAVGSA